MVPGHCRFGEITAEARRTQRRRQEEEQRERGEMGRDGEKPLHGF
jgi:hypothetical protein